MPIVISPHEKQKPKIALQTRLGNNIENENGPEISPNDRASFSDFKRKHPNAVERNNPTGIYNCHGLTFASKRTRIWATEYVNLILNNDSYSEVDSENIIAGDIIIYFALDGDIEHSGIVISNGIPPINVPMVYSKWGLYCELQHSAYDCPYETRNIKYYRIKDAA